MIMVLLTHYCAKLNTYREGKVDHFFLEGKVDHLNSDENIYK